MYLHLGQNVVIRQREIIGIFDMDNTTVSRETRSFLTKAEKKKQVRYVNMELPKSFVVCDPARRVRSRQTPTVYVAQVAPRTLYKRVQQTDLTESDKEEP